MKNPFEITVKNCTYVLRDLELDQVELVDGLLANLQNPEAGVVAGNFSISEIKKLLSNVLVFRDHPSEPVAAGSFSEAQAAEVLAAFLISRQQLKGVIMSKFTPLSQPTQ